MGVQRYKRKSLHANQLGLVEERARVLLVVAEHHGGGGEGGGRLGGDLRPGRLLVDLVQRPRRLHVLRPHPALVVQVGVADLNIKDGGWFSVVELTIDSTRTHGPGRDAGGSPAPTACSSWRRI